jgi:DNA-binding winged helix-turn-helix (wHTH) protein
MYKNETIGIGIITYNREKHKTFLLKNKKRSIFFENRQIKLTKQELRCIIVTNI